MEGVHWHDAIDYVRRRYGIDFRAACALLAIQAPAQRSPLPPVAPTPVKPPSDQWCITAERVLSDAFDQLYEVSDKPLAWLLSRGFTEETIAKALLGYNPADRWMRREEWGLPPLRDQRGRKQQVWLPRGIVIPWFIGRGHDAVIWKLMIRRPLTAAQKVAGESPYIQIPGGSNALYNADALERGKPAMLVEGVFDALAVRQAAGNLVAPVATGTTGARRIRWLATLVRAPLVLVSYDNDTAGEHAAAYWQQVLPETTRRWRPYWDDPAAMLTDQGDVRVWVEDGLRRVAEKESEQEQATP